MMRKAPHGIISSMTNKEQYIPLIQDMINSLKDYQSSSKLNEVYFRLVTLINNLYGVSDCRASQIAAYKCKHYDVAPNHGMHMESFANYLSGVLEAIKSDLDNNLIENIEKQAIGSVFADFIVLAKDSSSNNNKDVAAVLASAAIEDALKRYGTINGLEVMGKEMSEVINALKGAGLIKATQATILSSYVRLRNKALHAEWDKIGLPDVDSLISFTEKFVLENLS